VADASGIELVIWSRVADAQTANSTALHELLGSVVQYAAFDNLSEEAAIQALKKLIYLDCWSKSWSKAYNTW
jgi:hypothetical protein